MEGTFGQRFEAGSGDGSGDKVFVRREAGTTVRGGCLEAQVRPHSDPPTQGLSDPRGGNRGKVSF